MGAHALFCGFGVAGHDGGQDVGMFRQGQAWLVIGRKHSRAPDVIIGSQRLQASDQEWVVANGVERGVKRLVRQPQGGGIPKLGRFPHGSKALFEAPQVIFRGVARGEIGGGTFQHRADPPHFYQLVVIQRGDHGAAAWACLHHAFPLEPPKGLAHGLGRGPERRGKTPLGEPGTGHEDSIDNGADEPLIDEIGQGPEIVRSQRTQR